MNSKRRLNIKLIGLCAALCLSLASYLTLRFMESGTSHRIDQEILAEELDAKEALPDVQLLKKIMNKTLEFMLKSPQF